jgi:hypothetical protein
VQSVNSSEAKNMRAIAEFAAALPRRPILCRFDDEIKDRRDGKRSRLQNQCPVSDIIDLRQLICAVSAASLLQSGYPGHDVEMRERTTK